MPKAVSPYYPGQMVFVADVDGSWKLACIKECFSDGRYSVVLRIGIGNMQSNILFDKVLRPFEGDIPDEWKPCSQLCTEFGNRSAFEMPPANVSGTIDEVTREKYEENQGPQDSRYVWMKKDDPRIFYSPTVNDDPIPKDPLEGPRPKITVLADNALELGQFLVMIPAGLQVEIGYRGEHPWTKALMNHARSRIKEK